VKAAEGNSATESLAKFQVDAALLQATTWSIYFTYIAGNGTPGYSFGPHLQMHQRRGRLAVPRLGHAL
jgi:hypothetical protein